MDGTRALASHLVARGVGLHSEFPGPLAVESSRARLAAVSPPWRLRCIPCKCLPGTRPFLLRLTTCAMTALERIEIHDQAAHRH